MADEGALDPFAAIEAKYGAGLSEKMEARDVLARQLEALGPEYSSELALLKADYEKAKAASEIEQQLSLSCKIEELQRLKVIQRDFRRQQLADADVIIERIAMQKAREVKALKASMAASAEDD